MRCRIAWWTLALLSSTLFCNFPSQPMLAQPLYGKLWWIGSPLPRSSSWAGDISDDGTTVVGWFAVPQHGRNENHGFRWHRGVLEQLPTLGGTESSARGVSADGSIIVGWSRNERYQWRICRWVDGQIEEISVPYLFQQGWAESVSADGTVIVGAIQKHNLWHAFRWENGTLHTLGTIGGAQSIALAVSADGTVIAGWATTADSNWHAFRWENGVMQDLGTLGGRQSLARAVSADGNIIVGQAATADGASHAFRWENGVMQDLGTLGGTYSDARDISADGTLIVGASSDTTGRTVAFLWSAANGLSNLNTLYAHLLTDGSLLRVAIAISANGRYIVGNGWNAATQRDEVFVLDRFALTHRPELNTPPSLRILSLCPNPCNGVITARFLVPTREHLVGELLDPSGKIICTVLDTTLNSGIHTLTLDLHHLPSGVYWYQLRSQKAILRWPFYLLR